MVEIRTITKPSLKIVSIMKNTKKWYKYSMDMENNCNSKQLKIVTLHPQKKKSWQTLM
jgi:hypothetical protein